MKYMKLLCYVMLLALLVSMSGCQADPVAQS